MDGERLTSGGDPGRLVQMRFVAGHVIARERYRVRAMRELDLDKPPRPDDAADALAVALTGWFQR